LCVCVCVCARARACQARPHTRAHRSSDLRGMRSSPHPIPAQCVTMCDNVWASLRLSKPRRPGFFFIFFSNPLQKKEQATLSMYVYCWRICLFFFCSLSFLWLGRRTLVVALWSRDVGRDIYIMYTYIYVYVYVYIYYIHIYSYTYIYIYVYVYVYIRIYAHTHTHTHTHTHPRMCIYAYQLYTHINYIQCVPGTRREVEA